MTEGDGVYYTDVAEPHNRWISGLKKTAVALVGFGAVGAGAYYATTVITGPGMRSRFEHPHAQAPAVVEPSPSSAPTVPAPTRDAPVTGPLPGTKAAVRQDSTPSPTPSVSPPSDQQLAADQVSRLVQAPPPRGDANIQSEGDPVMVSTRAGDDGSVIRVVSAHYDLTGRRALLAVGDSGDVVGDALCTRNVLYGPARTAAVRPGIVVCWRTADDKGVVTVALGGEGDGPQASASVEALDDTWASLD